MRFEHVDRLGPTDQERIDVWFDKAMRDETVRPYLTTGTHFPRITIPEDDYDGVVLMDENNRGVLKIYMDEESRTARIGVWVLAPTVGDYARGETAFSLMSKAITIVEASPSVQFFATRVMSTNHHGQSFSDRLFEPWGREVKAVFDTNTSGHLARPNRWVDWLHYRSPIAEVKENMRLWEEWYTKEHYPDWRSAPQSS